MLCNACPFAERGHKGPPLYSGGVFDLHKSLKIAAQCICIANRCPFRRALQARKVHSEQTQMVVLPKLWLHADMRKGSCLRPTAVQAGGYGRAKNLAAVLPIYLAAVLPKTLLDADMLNTLTQSLTCTPAHKPQAFQLMLGCSRPSLYRALLPQSSRCSSPTRRARSTSPAHNTPKCYRTARRHCCWFWGGVANSHSNYKIKRVEVMKYTSVPGVMNKVFRVDAYIYDEREAMGMAGAPGPQARGGPQRTASTH